MKTLAERALEHVVLGNMNADMDWFEQHSPTSCSYWLGSLETMIESRMNPDGSAKIRAQTLLHENVSNPSATEQLCIVLNELSPSWSFIYSPERRHFIAVSSVNINVHEIEEPPLGIIEPAPFQNAWLLLFTESIWGMARLANEIVDHVSPITGGIAAHTHPQNKSGIREDPDVFLHLPDVVRQRPEWLQDYYPFMHWPAPSTVAELMVASVGEELGSNFEARLNTEYEKPVISITYEQNTIANWENKLSRDPRYGISFTSQVTLLRTPHFDKFELANRLNIQMFNLPTTTQLGNWCVNEDVMFFTQTMPSSFVRPLEESSAKHALDNYNPVFFSRLALRAAGAIECALAFAEADNGPGTELIMVDQTKALREFIDDLLQEPAREFISETSHSLEGSTASSLALRLNEGIPFFVNGIFNPIGPTVMSLEAFQAKDGEYHLMEFDRHPLYPNYRHLGKVSPGTKDAANLISESITRQLPHLPKYLDLSGCPEELLPEVESLVKSRMLTIAIEQRVDVRKHAERLKAIDESAWSRVDHSLPVIEETDRIPTEADIDDYFELVTSGNNLALFWGAIPDAWDGSLNYSLRNGVLNQTSAGPLIWTYNREIGN